MSSKTQGEAIAALEERVGTMIITLKDYIDEERRERTLYHTMLEDVKMKASHMERSVQDLQLWKAQITPSLSEVERWKQRGIGAWMFIVLVSGSVVAAVAAGWQLILAKLGFSTQ